MADTRFEVNPWAATVLAACEAWGCACLPRFIGEREGDGRVVLTIEHQPRCPAHHLTEITLGAPR